MIKEQFQISLRPAASLTSCDIISIELYVAPDVTVCDLK